MRTTLPLVAGLALFASVAGAPSPRPSALAGTAVSLDVQGLVDGSELVLEGRTVGATSFADERGVILTEYELHVDRTFLGEEAALQRVVLPGGVLPDGRGMLLAGMPQLEVGKRSILFLSEPGGATGARMPVGLSQGRIRVLDAPGGERVAVCSHSGLVVADPKTGLLTDAAAVDVLDYAGLVAEIRASVATKRARAEAR